jgi:hypothetical protein
MMWVSACCTEGACGPSSDPAILAPRGHDGRPGSGSRPSIKGGNRFQLHASTPLTANEANAQYAPAPAWPDADRHRVDANEEHDGRSPSSSSRTLNGSVDDLLVHPCGEKYSSKGAVVDPSTGRCRGRCAHSWAMNACLRYGRFAARGSESPERACAPSTQGVSDSLVLRGQRSLCRPGQPSVVSSAERGG